MWYNGYREQNMLVVFITLWCATSYYAKVYSQNARCLQACRIHDE
jgi:hypothetical protein